MAARKLGKAAVPCKVRRYPDRLSELRALMGANVHRRSLSSFDMARQLETLREVPLRKRTAPDGTKEQAELMAAQSDLSRATVERYLDLLNLNETMTGWAERGELPRLRPSPAPAANPLRTVDSFGRAVRRSTAQLKALDLSADVDRTSARKKLDTCLANLEELQRTVEALKAGLDG
ncbi:MAG: hypothetical protein ACLU38_07450 [Dysosmobacter sp.]